MKLYETLENQLKKENNFVTDEGELKKWVVIGKARNYDPMLIKLLLENNILKEKFFVEVEGTLVFKQEEFITFMEMKNYLNDSYTQYKNKVGLTIDGKYLKQRNEVALVWPFKDCVLEGGQTKEEQKREEIFFNEILAQDEITQLFEPKVLTNAKVYDKNGEQEFKGFTRDAKLNKKRGLPEDTITDNLIIKGNNLLALHSLKKEFAGKVKLIYIDPPYNTGNDGFKYNDSFNHSTWLTFMKNRLEVAKDLLKDDGVIFVQCDDNEQAYLKVLMDEIFKIENFVANGIVIINRGGRDYGGIARTHEYLLVYSKTINYDLNGIEEKNKKFPMEDEIGGFEPRELRNRNIIFNKQNRPNLYYPFYLNPNNKDKNGLFELSLEKKEGWVEVFPLKSQGINTVWRWGKERAKKYLNIDVKGKAKSGGGYMIIQKYRATTKMQRSIFDDKEFVNERGTEHIKGLFGNKKFAYPKSEFLLNRIIELATKENDIVLDYHLGSGTTASTAHKMGRQYIGIEQMDYIETVAVERLEKVIGKKVSVTKEKINQSKLNLVAEEQSDYYRCEYDKGGISKNVNWKGGGSFIYLELKKYNQVFIEKIQEANTTEELLAIWEQMKERSFLNYNVDLKKQEEHIEEFKKLSIEEQKQHLVEILDKNQLYVNLSSMNDKDFEITDKEKQVTKDFYRIK